MSASSSSPWSVGEDPLVGSATLRLGRWAVPRATLLAQEPSSGPPTFTQSPKAEHTPPGQPWHGDSDHGQTERDVELLSPGAAADGAAADDASPSHLPPDSWEMAESPAMAAPGPPAMKIPGAARAGAERMRLAAQMAAAVYDAAYLPTTLRVDNSRKAPPPPSLDELRGRWRTLHAQNPMIKKYHSDQMVVDLQRRPDGIQAVGYEEWARQFRSEVSAAFANDALLHVFFEGNAPPAALASSPRWISSAVGLCRAPEKEVLMEMRGDASDVQLGASGAYVQYVEVAPPVQRERERCARVLGVKVAWVLLSRDGLSRDQRERYVLRLALEGAVGMYVTRVAKRCMPEVMGCRVVPPSVWTSEHDIGGVAIAMDSWEGVPVTNIAREWAKANSGPRTRRPDPNAFPHLARVVWGALRALHRMHVTGVAHGDPGLQNFLYDRSSDDVAVGYASQEAVNAEQFDSGVRMIDAGHAYFFGWGGHTTNWWAGQSQARHTESGVYRCIADNAIHGLTESVLAEQNKANKARHPASEGSYGQRLATIFAGQPQFSNDLQAAIAAQESILAEHFKDGELRGPESVFITGRKRTDRRILLLDLYARLAEKPIRGKGPPLVAVVAAARDMTEAFKGLSG